MAIKMNGIRMVKIMTIYCNDNGYIMVKIITIYGSDNGKYNDNVMAIKIMVQ